VKLLVSLPEKDNEFQAIQAAEAEEAGRRLELPVDVQYAQNNGILQITQILKAIRSPEPPAGIVLEPVTVNGLESVIRKVAAAGVGLAILNTTADSVDDLRAQYPGLALFTVASDQVEIGRIQGQQVRALLPSGGGILYIHGAAGSSAAKERFDGFTEVVGQHGNLGVTSLYALWTQDSAEQAVQNWLKYNSATPIHVVAAQDDSMARGARRAFDAVTGEGAACWKALAYLGIDGVPTVGRRFVDEGQLTGTVIMPSNTGAAIDHLSRWLRHKTVPAAVRLAVRSYPSQIELMRKARISA
jgi:inositol transport system substrate-binding protein